MKISQTIYGMIWLIFFLILTIKLYSWITTIAELIEDDYFKALYWTGAIILIILINIITPYIIIIGSFQDDEN